VQNQLSHLFPICTENGNVKWYNHEQTACQAVLVGMQPAVPLDGSRLMPLEASMLLSRFRRYKKDSPRFQETSYSFSSAG
jgi:hypothetical protein